MGILESIFGGKPTDDKDLRELLKSLPEPPKELQETLNGLLGSVQDALSGKPCRFCGKVHGASDPQVPEYNESAGAAAEVEWTPREMTAIQFLPTNVGEVLNFLHQHKVPFGYMVTPSGGERVLLLDLTSPEVDVDTEVLVYGKWAVVSGSRENGDLAYVTYDDEIFRRQLRVKSPATTSETSDSAEEELDQLGDDLLNKAEQGALSAYNGE